MMCPSLAILGTCGQSNSHVVVDVKVDPSGIVTVNLLIAFLMF